MSSPELLKASVIVQTVDGNKVIKLEKTKLDMLIPVLFHLNQGEIKLQDLSKGFEIDGYIID